MAKRIQISPSDFVKGQLELLEQYTGTSASIHAKAAVERWVYSNEFRDLLARGKHYWEDNGSPQVQIIEEESQDGSES